MLTLVGNGTYAERARELIDVEDLRSVDPIYERWFGPTTGEEIRPSHAREGAGARLKSIGPWQPVAHGSAVWYERNDGAADVGMWADAGVLAPKRHPHRILLFGESVCRGYGLDPLFNCAGSLRAHLQSAGLSQTTDVVDLARNASAPALILETMRAAAPLQGDLYVVFAGNSWMLTEDQWNGDAMVRSLQREASWAPVAAAVEQMAAAFAARTVTSILAVAREHAAHVVFMIPPYNLRDWLPDPTAVHPLLDDGELELRATLVDRARQLLADGRPADAKVDAARAVELEEGLGPVSLHLLGRCAAAMGDSATAYSLYERARDALFVLPGPRVPGCPTVVADAIRAAGAAGATVIDVAAQLRRTNAGAAPGREYFLDGWHLSAPGIHVAMSLLAEQLVPRLAGEAPVAVGGAVTAPDVSPEALAQGHLSGALFSGFFGQRDEVRAYCRAAVHSHPAMADAMRLYVDRARRRAPDLLCASYQELRYLEGTFPWLRYMRQWNKDAAQPKRIYSDLLEAMCESLAESDAAGVDRLRALSITEHTLSRGPIDLLDPASWERPLCAVGFIQSFRHDYFVAYARRSDFRLVADDESSSAHISLTTRIVHGRPDGRTIALLVNGVPRHTWPATREWLTTTCVLPADTLAAGTNTLTIAWPGHGLDRGERATQAAGLIARGFASDSAAGLSVRLYPVFGELHAFTATAAGRPDASGDGK